MGNLYAVDSGGKTVPNVSAFKYGPQANAVSGISSSIPLFASDFNNLQPRVGAAWDVRGKGRTVLRAAWGMYTDRYFQRLFDFGVLNPPYAKSALLTFFPFPKGGQIPLNTGLPPQGRFVDPGLHNPTTYRYSGALEQRIFSNTSVTVSYVGLRATGLFRWQEPNGLGSVPQAARPDPRFARYRYTDNSGDSVYNSFQTFARHRFSKGIDFTVSYAYGRSLDTIRRMSGIIHSATLRPAWRSSLRSSTSMAAPRPAFRATRPAGHLTLSSPNEAIPISISAITSRSAT